MKTYLNIQSPSGSLTAVVTDELSVGRTDSAELVIDDAGLSRKNTTFFIDDGSLFVVDENSLNGTYVNGERLVGPPRRLNEGDEIKIGSGTTIRLAVSEESTAAPLEPADPQSSAHGRQETPSSSAMPLIIAAAVALSFIIVVIASAAYLIVSQNGTASGNAAAPAPQINNDALIPVRVIDPLGGENEDDLDDLIASWEVQETEIKAENVADISAASGTAEEAELNVTAAFLADRQKKALEDRPGEKGATPAGLIVPPELFGGTVIKQKMKLREMNTLGYRQPLDFAELADKRLNKELVEMPMAAQSYYLDVGGSAQDAPFSAFSFAQGSSLIAAGSPKYASLSRLAENFSGQKYDLNNAADRRQMRIRLLRMFNPRARPILKELADAYFRKFGRPLRVTSLTRSMDYQIALNANNRNSFKVSGEGSLPPHTSGCAFDLARKHMPADEQNFVMQQLAEMERAGRIDALIEYGVNACFHIFVYNDGRPPQM